VPATLLPSSVELVGPKGYVHGWHYVGGAGLPSVAKHNLDRPKAGNLKAGDRVAALFTHKGAAGAFGSPNRKLSTHQVMSVSHSGSGKNRRTHLVMRDTKTGETHRQSLPSHAKVIARVSKAPGFAPIKNGRTSNQSSFRASGVGLAAPATSDANEGPAMTLDFATPKLGSGDRFRRLSARLAARGARNPDALAAYIGRRKYGAGGMGHLSHGKHLANSDLGIYLAETAKDNQGMTLTCPECGHTGSAGSFGASGASTDSQPGELRTPAPDVSGVRNGAVVNISGKAASHALASTRQALELAAVTGRRPIHGPMDVLVKRGTDGTAVLHHRHGGAQIASLRKTPEGKWVASVAGRDMQPRDHQRTALLEAVGAWNGSIAGARPQVPPLQPEPRQTPLMEQFGIPAMRSAGFATPVTSASDGPRATMSSADGGDGDNTDDNGLTPRGQAIYKKLIAKGFPQARALAFAKNAQKAKAGKFGTSGS
jgi:hypothetical protein